MICPRLLSIRACSTCLHLAQIPKEQDDGIYRCSNLRWKEVQNIIEIPEWCPLPKGIKE